MTDDATRLGLLVNLYELAITRLFDTVPGGLEAKRLFVEDVRQVLDRTNEIQPHSPAAQTYEALLRRFGATTPDDASGLGVVPTPEQGLPSSGSGV